jgi:hypothetical protein
MADRIRINGIAHSWGSVKLTIGGEKYSGVSSVTYSDKLEIAYGYGMGAGHRPRSISRGKYTPEQVVMKCEAATADQIRKQLARLGNGKSYGIAQVVIVLQYLEPSDLPITIKFDKCRLVEDNTSDEEGADVLTVELKFAPFGIERNGLTLYEDRK